jgi:hypothetical protein
MVSDTQRHGNGKEKAGQSVYPHLIMLKYRSNLASQNTVYRDY